MSKQMTVVDLRIKLESILRDMDGLSDDMPVSLHANDKIVSDEGYRIFYIPSAHMDGAETLVVEVNGIE